MTETVTIQRSLVLDVERCCQCGIEWGMTRALRAQRLDDGDWFYCPNGHGQHFTKSTKDELREAQRKLASVREDLRVRSVELAAARDELSQSQSELKRQTQRSKGGACPCCNRSFVQLARHMKAKHPDYVEAT